MGGGSDNEMDRGKMLKRCLNRPKRHANAPKRRTNTTNNMRKIIAAIIAVALLAPTVCRAQNADDADAKAGNCINNSQWFALQRIYSADSANLSPFIRQFSKAMLATVFNHPREATEAITTLLRRHQAEMGGGNIVSMVSILGKNYSAMGDNAAAEAVLRKLTAQLDSSSDTAVAGGLRRQQHVYEVLGRYRLYANADTTASLHTVPFTLDRVAGDSAMVLMHVNGTLNGGKCQMTFDTGASYNAISPELARKYKLTITDAQVPVAGTRPGSGRIAIAHRFTLGSLTLRDVPFVILNFNRGNERARHITDAYGCIIGEALLMQFPAYGINFADSTVTLFCTPLGTSRQSPNICILPSGSTPRAEVEYAGSTFALTLDTGASVSSLGNAFYKGHTADVARTGKWDIAASTGFGGITYDSVFRLPELRLSVSGKPFTLHNVAVSALSTDNLLSAEYGRLGLDFFRFWKKVTVDNRAMRLTMEE